MHCKNPLCYEDSCNGECKEVREEERSWPWYRYDGEQVIEIKEEPKPL
jgi:hypothetical protein